MAYSPSNKCTKNLCKCAVLVQLIIKNVSHIIFGTQCTAESNKKAESQQSILTNMLRSIECQLLS